MDGVVQLQRSSFPGRPAFDAALSRALLQGVAEGRTPQTLRLYAPDDVLAFSVLDRTRSGFAGALAAARERGFRPILRLAGGRAAAFLRHSVAFAWSVPVVDPRRGIRQRFETMAAIVAGALRRLGVDARIGELPGEYCPGAHSVNAGGRTKLAGIGQRVVRGAAHVGGVVLVGGSERARQVLVPVYRELGFALDPERVGSVEDELGPVSAQAVIGALVAEVRERAQLVEAELDASHLARAADLEPHHRLGPTQGPDRRGQG